MAYLNLEELKELGLKSYGNNVKISDKACIYEPNKIQIGNDCRIDDFCIISGKVTIGNFCHITPMCLIAGGTPGVFIEDYCTLAYGVKIFSQSDDYSGETLVNSLIPKEYKNEKFARVIIRKHTILGCNTVVHPGVELKEGTASGAMTLFLKSNESWGIYVGAPAKKIKERSRKLVNLEKIFNGEVND